MHYRIRYDHKVTVCRLFENEVYTMMQWLLSRWEGEGGFRPFNFENTILSYGLGVMTHNLRVALGTCAPYCPCEASEQKYWSKIENLKICDRAKLLIPFDSSRRADHFGVVGCQNRIKMSELCQLKVGAKVVSWPIFGWKLVILAIFFLRYGLQIDFAHHSH